MVLDFIESLVIAESVEPLVVEPVVAMLVLDEQPSEMLDIVEGSVVVDEPSQHLQVFLLNIESSAQKAPHRGSDKLPPHKQYLNNKSSNKHFGIKLDHALLEKFSVKKITS